MKSTTYEEIRPSLKNGDSVSFAGRSPASMVVRAVTLSKWTHDGLIVIAPEIDTVLCWESTTLSNVPDVETGEIESGVMLVNFSERIKSYKGDIGIRRLRTPLTAPEIGVMLDMQRELRGTKYEANMLELFKAAYDGPFGLNIADLSTIFCTELKAEFYRRVERLPEDPPSNEYTPKDMAGSKMNLYLEDMIMIKR